MTTTTGPRYSTEPVFSFTSDLDWASEGAIRETLDVFESRGIPLTPFVTHHSEQVAARFAERGAVVGVHPNFFPQSSHGANESEVWDAAQELWPEARGFRSHGYFDTANLVLAAKDRGFAWDSNVPLLLQEGLVPLEHCADLLRFPVFWEDDVHLYRGLSLDFDDVVAHFDTPGLKVINVHPAHVALNSPSVQYYEDRKGQSNAARFEGAGVATLLDALIEHVQERGYACHSLDDLSTAWQPFRPKLSASMRTDDEAEEDSHDGQASAYQHAALDDRAEMLRADYDHRDAESVYATSRDTNLRELEIEFIRSHVTGGRVIDLGCGNGYTLISLARTTDGTFHGVDFSATMIEGARRLSAASPGLRAKLSFEEGDVRRLPFDDSTFDFVVSERCLLNLPSRDDQWSTLNEIHRLLVPGGTYVMVEGTEDGLERLNSTRESVGLDPIPSVSDENYSSLKFHESELESFLDGLFDIADKRYFGAYYLVSRVIQPLLALPRQPSFSAALNERARAIELSGPHFGDIGHVVGYALVARKPT